MKLNFLALSALVALAAAADSTTSDAPATTTSAEVQCAKSCAANDVCCIAKCYNVPCPSVSQANDTISCVSACPQGTGSPSDIKQFSNCEQNCYSSHFFPAGAASTAASSATASDSSATQTGSQSSHTTGSGSSSSTSSATGAAHTTHNAANNVKLGASGAGLLGLVLAAFAL